MGRKMAPVRIFESNFGPEGWGFESLRGYQANPHRGPERTTPIQLWKSLPRRPPLYPPNGTTQPFGGVMDSTEAVAFVDVVVAVIGYFVTYRTNLRLAQRNDRLERINRLLSEFYGPLLALTRSSDQSWQAFRKRYRP